MNWYFLIPISVHQISSFEGDEIASLEQRLERLVAFGLVLEQNNNKDLTGHLSPALGTADMRFSFGFSAASIPPCQFFCLVSCVSATYSSPFSSVFRTK